MEIEGVVASILPPVKGTSARGEWTKQEVIFEQPGEFSRKVCISFWGDKALDAAGLKPGEKVKVSVNVESREHNGRWYTEVRAWKMVRGEAAMGAGAYGAPPAYGAPMPAGGDYGVVQGGGFAQPSPSAAGFETAVEEGYDDLPF